MIFEALDLYYFSCQNYILFTVWSWLFIGWHSKIPGKPQEKCVIIFSTFNHFTPKSDQYFTFPLQPERPFPHPLPHHVIFVTSPQSPICHQYKMLPVNTVPRTDWDHQLHRLWSRMQSVKLITWIVTSSLHCCTASCLIISDLFKT